jgi:hypothetical protein
MSAAESGAPEEDVRTNVIEHTIFVKSRGVAPSLLGRGRDRGLPKQQEGVSIREDEQRVPSTESDPGCKCSTTCGGRCRCRKASQRCRPYCHVNAPRRSIREFGEAVCCGHVRYTSEGKEVWPEGWTRTEIITGKGCAERIVSKVDIFWKMQLQDQTPAAKLIQQAGGIDAFLLQEGYGLEFGLFEHTSQASEDGDKHTSVFCEVLGERVAS